MNAKILLVDDDRNMLAATERNLRQKFNVETADSAEAALVKLETSGPFAVVLSDRDMPGLDGVQLLNKIKERWPDTVRMMLTGHADLTLVVRLVNENNIFRFLIKPCASSLIVKAIEDALELYRLAVAEKELLNDTLNGSIKLLTDILFMVEPPSSGSSQTLREAITRAADRMGVKDSWEIHMAAMLAPIGKVTVPPETLVRFKAGQPLSPAEDRMLASLPETTARLLRNIPRLEGVARIVLYQNKRFDGSGYPSDNLAGENIPFGARLLRIIQDFIDLESKGKSSIEALEAMRLHQGLYDPALLERWGQTFEANAEESEPTVLPSMEVSVKSLAGGMVLRSNVETKDGLLILSAGHKLNGLTLEKIRNFASVVGVREPIIVERTDAFG